MEMLSVNTALLFLTFLPFISGQIIRCYSCLAPKDAVDLGKYCTDDSYCTGTYCFKGPDTTSTGIVHGCVNSPPIDGSTAGVCKLYEGTQLKENCYCKNIDYCNFSIYLPLAILFLIPIFIAL